MTLEQRIDRLERIFKVKKGKPVKREKIKPDEIKEFSKLLKVKTRKL